MPCPDESALLAFAGGAAALPAAPELERHLARCDGCRAGMAFLVRQTLDPSGAEGAPLGAAPVELEPASAPRVGRFEPLERLGSGGISVVYAAWDPLLERKVALK